MEERPGSAAAVSSSQGPQALTPESSGNSSNGDLEREEQGMVMDPLLSSSSNMHDDGSDHNEDEIYELNERGSREIGRAHSRPRNGFSYTAEEERAVVDKFDRRLVLFVAFLYMLSFLDRSSPSYFPYPPC